MRSSSVSVLRRLLINSGAGSVRQGAAIGSWRPLIHCHRQPHSAPPTHIADAVLCSSSVSSQFLTRTLASSSGSGNICLVKTEEQFSSALNKIQEESSPAILYFTAAWCGPCRFMSPVLEDLSGKYPNVTTYKIDIDQEGIQDKLYELRIDSVPRLHFFKDGKKVDEIIGADIERLKSTMEELYKA